MLIQPQGPNNRRYLEIKGLAVGTEDSISMGFLCNLTMPPNCGHLLYSHLLLTRPFVQGPTCSSKAPLTSLSGFFFYYLFYPSIWRKSYKPQHRASALPRLYFLNIFPLPMSHYENVFSVFFKHLNKFSGTALRKHEFSLQKESKIVLLHGKYHSGPARNRV